MDLCSSKPCCSRVSCICEQFSWFWGQEDPLEKGMAAYSSILAWRIPWTEETGQLQSMGSQRVRHDWITNTHWSTWRQWCLFFNHKWTLMSARPQNSNFFPIYSLIWIWNDDMDPIMLRAYDYEYEHLHTKDVWIQTSPHTLSIYPALSISFSTSSNQTFSLEYLYYSLWNFSPLRPFSESLPFYSNTHSPFKKFLSLRNCL